mmetsp:Transcript_53897/g.125747  ORF Transcript_53897/g.125747 Transcript_53897/m.125747 type:complete len:293 (+) Transcript_53897:218-1096(+)
MMGVGTGPFLVVWNANAPDPIHKLALVHKRLRLSEVLVEEACNIHFRHAASHVLQPLRNFEDSEAARVVPVDDVKEQVVVIHRVQSIIGDGQGSHGLELAPGQALLPIVVDAVQERLSCLFCVPEAHGLPMRGQVFQHDLFVVVNIQAAEDLFNLMLFNVRQGPEKPKPPLPGFQNPLLGPERPVGHLVEELDFPDHRPESPPSACLDYRPPFLRLRGLFQAVLPPQLLLPHNGMSPVHGLPGDVVLLGELETLETLLIPHQLRQTDVKTKQRGLRLQRHLPDDQFVCFVPN